MLAPPTTVSRPCKHGHTLGRYRNGKCIECAKINALVQVKRQRTAAWKAAHPNRIRDKGRAYRKNNPEQGLLESARGRARKGGFACTITIADIIVPEFCPLLGIKLERGKGSGGFRPSSPTLDKIRPELGYVPGNVWVISHRANAIKGNATLLELQLLVSNLANVVRTYPWGA